jgi:hypothetical protein
VHGGRVVGIEGRVVNERPRRRNTGAKMVMDGCTNGDRVDEVRVRHVRQVGHGVVLSRLCDLRDLVFYRVVFRKKVSNLGAKSFRCSYFWCHIFA